jgi:hypothetical protein
VVQLAAMKNRHPLEWIMRLQREEMIEGLDYEMREFLRREQKLKGFRTFIEYVEFVLGQELLKHLRERGEGEKAARLRDALREQQRGPGGEQYYELQHVAWVLGMSERAIAGTVKRGELRVDTVSPDIVSEEEVERFMRASGRKSDLVIDL